MDEQRQVGIPALPGATCESLGQSLGVCDLRFLLHILKVMRAPLGLSHQMVTDSKKEYVSNKESTLQHYMKVSSFKRHRQAGSKRTENNPNSTLSLHCQGSHKSHQV